LYRNRKAKVGLKTHDHRYNDQIYGKIIEQTHHFLTNAINWYEFDKNGGSNDPIVGVSTWKTLIDVVSCSGTE